MQRNKLSKYLNCQPKFTKEELSVILHGNSVFIGISQLLFC